MTKINEIAKIIGNCDTGFLSTAGLDGVPETRAMCNMANIKQLRGNSNVKKLELFFSTSPKSPKIEQIKKNPASSVYCYIPANMQNMTLFGRSEVITDRATKDAVWQDEWSNYYKNGRDDEDYCVIRFTPTAYKYYVMEGSEIKKQEGKI